MSGIVANMPRTPPGETRERVYRYVRERLFEGRPPRSTSPSSAACLSIRKTFISWKQRGRYSGSFARAEVSLKEKTLAFVTSHRVEQRAQGEVAIAVRKKSSRILRASVSSETSASWMTVRTRGRSTSSPTRTVAIARSVPYELAGVPMLLTRSASGTTSELPSRRGRVSV